MAAGSLQNLAGLTSLPSQSDLLIANYFSGMQLNNRMSAVRRFFCLFVTFDLCFTCIFWIMCVLVNGSNLDALIEQIEYYTIRTSIFDVVICSLCRFVFLILFYAILHINHWWLVAMVTMLSCAFLIAKALLYEWPHDSSYPFEVLLVLASFIVSWAEAWFVDYRVLPQEARANSILEAASGAAQANWRDGAGGGGLQRVRDYLSQYTESIANFYSPLQSPADSGDEDDDDDLCIPSFRQKPLSAIESDYVAQAETSFKMAIDTVNSQGWDIEKTISHTDVIFSKKIGGRKVYRLAAIVESDPKVMLMQCIKQFDEIPTWNKAITQARHVQAVTKNVDITYHAAAGGGGGVVKPRDFVGVRKWERVSPPLKGWAVGGISITHSQVPLSKDFVRGTNGPNCMVFGRLPDRKDCCALQWLLDVDLNCWLPQYVLDPAMMGVMTDFLEDMKAHAAATNAVRDATASAAIGSSSRTPFTKVDEVRTAI